MRSLYLVFICLFLLSMLPGSASSQNYTSMGTDFWVAYQANISNSATLRIYIGAMSNGDTVQITIGEGTPNEWKRKYWVPANTTIASQDIPGTGAQSARLPDEGLYINKGIHITTKQHPVVAYAHLIEATNSGATMLLPVNLLGNENYILSYTQNFTPTSAGVFLVVATEDSTWVQITPSSLTKLGWTPGSTHLVKLNKGDVYQVLTASPIAEFTGSVVRAVANNQGKINPIAVFGGSTRTYIYCNATQTGGGDLLFQQVFPSQIWGKRYLTAPFMVNSLFMTTIYRVLVKDPSTVVKRNGITLTSLINGMYYQFESTTPEYISSNKPILLAQYMPSGGCNSASNALGDPEMIYLTPLENAIPKTAFYRNHESNIDVNAMDLIIPTPGLASLKIDGVLYNASPNVITYAHPALSGYHVVNKRWSPSMSAQSRVESDYAFTGITYGAGVVESYGYNLGAQYDSLNLESIEYNTIIGTFFLDQNKNGVNDSNEPLFPYAKLQAVNNTDTSYSYTSDGSFMLLTDTGAYITSAIPFSPYYTAVPAKDTSVFSTYNNRDSITFAIQSIGAVRDMGIGMIPVTPARPGFPATYRIAYGNKGTDTADIVIKLAKSYKLNYTSSSLTPSSVTADTIKWNISSLKPADYGFINVNFTLATPPVLNNGDTLTFVSQVSSDKIDQTPADNIFILKQRVTGSYDPNDKTESHYGAITKTAVENAEPLNYTIRFQNTGTDTAFNITIKDTLDTKLKWNTLKMVDASHDYTMLLNDDGICTWTFSNIHLVDSNKNEALSHGFISFTIEPKSTLNAGDIISNSASIYFDHNLPVLTNTTTTTVVTTPLPVKLTSFIAQKKENNNQLTWEISGQVNFSHFEIQRSENGMEFATIGKVNYGATYHYFDNGFRKVINYYRLKMVDKDGKFEYSEIRRINNQSAIDVGIFPNPVNDVMQVKVESPVTDNLSLQVINAEGKILMTMKLAIMQGETLIPINTGKLAKGVYLLRTIFSKNEPVILKFEKR